MKNNIKEIGKLTIALAVLVLFVSTASAQPVATEFGVNDTSGDPGTFVLVPVNIKNVQNEPIAGIVFDISFDSSVLNLTKAHVQRGDLTSAWDSPGYNPINGRIQIVFGGSGTEIPVGESGSIVVLNFSVVGAPGAKSAMNISGIQLSGLEGALGTATANNGIFIITGQVIEKKLTTITVSPSTATLTTGEAKTFTATAKDQNNAPISGTNITWTSSDTSIGTVVPEMAVTDANGSATTTFTALAPGTASVSAASGNVTGKANITVSPPPQQSMVNATREIEKESLGKGESTNITIRINSNIIQALSLKEPIPAGWNLTRISDDADGFKNRTNEWTWSNVTPGITKTVIYAITAPTDAAGTYYINGTISNSSGVIAIVGGNNIITLDILAYYRRLGSNPYEVETTDLLKAMDDWRSKTAPVGFERPITILELSALFNEWALN